MLSLQSIGKSTVDSIFEVVYANGEMLHTIWELPSWHLEPLDAQFMSLLLRNTLSKFLFEDQQIFTMLYSMISLHFISWGENNPTFKMFMHGREYIRLLVFSPKMEGIPRHMHQLVHTSIHLLQCQSRYIIPQKKSLTIKVYNSQRLTQIKNAK